MIVTEMMMINDAPPEVKAVLDLAQAIDLTEAADGERAVEAAPAEAAASFEEAAPARVREDRRRRVVAQTCQTRQPS